LSYVIIYILCTLTYRKIVPEKSIKYKVKLFPYKEMFAIWYYLYSLYVNVLKNSLLTKYVVQSMLYKVCTYFFLENLLIKMWPGELLPHLFRRYSVYVSQLFYNKYNIYLFIFSVWYTAFILLMFVSLSLKK
jgi:hypothetical protein